MADNIKDDVELKVASKGKAGYQAVDPITRDPVGPLRYCPAEAQADEEQDFERSQRPGKKRK